MVFQFSDHRPCKIKVIGNTEITIPKVINALNAPVGLLGVLGQTKDTKKTMTISGILCNRAIIYNLIIYTDSMETSLIGLGRDRKKFEGLMIVSDDSNTIYVMEVEEDKKEFTFYEMKKTESAK